MGMTRGGQSASDGRLGCDEAEACVRKDGQLLSSLEVRDSMESISTRLPQNDRSREVAHLGCRVVSHRLPSNACRDY